MLSLINNTDKEFKILPKTTDIKLTVEEQKNIRTNYITMLDKKIIKNELNQTEIDLIMNNKDVLLKDKALKLLENDFINDKITYQHSLSKNLDRLFNEIDSKERETGLYELYIGYPFIEGKLLDGTMVRAPLFLFPSIIFKKDGDWFYKNICAEKIFINKVFLIAFSDINKISITHILEEYEFIEDIFNCENKIDNITTFTQYCKNWGNSNNIVLKTDLFSDNFELMKDYKKDDYKNYKDGELFLKNHLLLGQYSVDSNVIYKEIDAMMNENNLPLSVKNFLNFDTTIINHKENRDNTENSFKNFKIQEIENFFITELDYCQEKAVKLSDKLDGLVIYGPPGTGKSQVIANIVADFIIKNKKVLVVSEKRTALDVVYKRLEKSGLGVRVAIAHDSKKDRQTIMNKLIYNYENVVNKDYFDDSIFEEKSHIIQSKINSLDKLANELHKKRNIGTSLYNLYTNSKANELIIKDIVLNFKEYDYFNIDSLKVLLHKLTEIKDYIIFDNTTDLISLRKSFSNYSIIDKKNIINNFLELKDLLNNQTLYNISEKLLKKIEILNLEKIWKENNLNKSLLYDNVEELLKQINEFEIIKEQTVELKEYDDNELEKIENIKIKSIANKIKILNCKNELLQKIKVYENNYLFIKKTKETFENEINSLDLENFWKSNNSNYSNIYDNVEFLNDYINEYEDIRILKDIKLSEEELNIAEDIQFKKIFDSLFTNNILPLLFDEIYKFELTYLEIQDVKKTIQNKIHSFDLSEIFKSNNKEISYIYDIVEEVYSDMELYENSFFLSFNRFKLSKKLKKIFKSGKFIENKEIVKNLIEKKKTINTSKIALENEDLDILTKKELLINTVNINNIELTIFSQLEKRFIQLENDLKSIENKILNIYNSTNLIQEILKKNGLFYFLLKRNFLKKIIQKYFIDDTLENKKQIIENIIKIKKSHNEIKTKLSSDIDILKKIEIIINESNIHNFKSFESILEKSHILESENSKIDTYLKENTNYSLYTDIKEEIKNFKGFFHLSVKRILLKDNIQKYYSENKSDNIKNLLQQIYSIKNENVKTQTALISNISVKEKIVIIQNNPILSESYKTEIIDLQKSIDTLKSIIKNLLEYFREEFQTIIYNCYIEPHINKLLKTLEFDFENIKIYDIKKKNFNTNEVKLLQHFIKNNSPNYLKNLENTYYIKWIQVIEQEIGDILITIHSFDSETTNILNLMDSKKKLVSEYIEKKLNENIKNNFQYNRQYNDIFYRNLLAEARKKRNKLSLRKFIELFKDEGLFTLIPCWLLTPETVSEIIPYKQEFFDVVIFDEASQMFVEKSLPSIYRAKKVIVAGDDKQLKPNVVGIKRIDDDENEIEETIENEYIDNSAITVESLLDLAKERYKGTLLNYHYRSKYPELITFSNYAFYNGRLITVPNKKILDNPPIEVIKVENGFWEDQLNMEEVIRVYKLVKEIFVNRKDNESIGIVTFNAKQQNAIKDYLDDICEKDEYFRNIYEKEKIRYDGSEDQSIFVKNIENVQGDERDVIIFSTAYAKDIKTGKIAVRFGTLSQEGGENRLNVAISRAKSKIYIVTSIEPEMLNVEATKNNGPKLLKKYLQYARAVSFKNSENIKSIIDSFERISDNNRKADEFDSPFEIEVCEKLREKNLIVHTQIGDSGYKIDLAIYDENKSDYILGIECDGATYHSSPSARERDIYRQKFLETKGWNIHRIWSKNWWENPEKEINKIIEKLKRIKSSI